jgi:uncharacterized protein (TIGR03084 family)
MEHQDLVDALEAQQAELTALLAGLDDAGWARPTPCEGWDVADVVLHLVQTNVMAQASHDGRFEEAMAELAVGLGPAADVDEGAAAMVARDRGLPHDVLLERWRTEAAALAASLREGDPDEKVTWVAGQLRRRTLATTRLAETWIHTADVAAALDVPLPPTARLEAVARLAWRTLPYAFQRAGRTPAGPVAFDLVGPDGARWRFDPDEPAVTVVRGAGAELCAVAARRLDPATTGLVAEGLDADAVLELVRTYA